MTDIVELKKEIEWHEEENSRLRAEVQWHEEENNRLREALHKARNTLGGLGFPKIASDICDSALEGKE